MLFGRYHFYGTFEDEAVLPVFKGSTFRGVFGVALKKVVCALKQQECAACLLREQCLYARIFETPSRPGDGRPSPPHPFVIEPMLLDAALQEHGLGAKTAVGHGRFSSAGTDVAAQEVGNGEISTAPVATKIPAKEPPRETWEKASLTWDKGK
jgi:hypothetical protein